MIQLILGQRRQGKSTRALAEAGSRSKWVIIWDPNWNYRSTGIISVRSADDLNRLMSIEQSPDVTEPVLIRIGPFESTEIDQAFSVYGSLLWQWDDYSFIIDESHMLQSRWKIHPILDRFARRTPANVHCIQTSHRFMELNNLTRFLFDELVIFRNEQESELKVLADQYGIDPERVRNLSNRQYLKWFRDGEGTGHWFIQDDPTSWYIDLANPNAQRTDIPAGPVTPVVVIGDGTGDPVVDEWRRQQAREEAGRLRASTVLLSPVLARPVPVEPVTREEPLLPEPGPEPAALPPEPEPTPALAKVDGVVDEDDLLARLFG